MGRAGSNTTIDLMSTWTTKETPARMSEASPWSRLCTSLGIQHEERGLVAGLFLHSVLIGTALIFTFTSASSLFLKYIGPSGLPYAYLAVGVVGPFTSWLYLRLVHLFPEPIAWRLNLVGLVLVFLILRLLFSTGSVVPAAFALLLWYRVVEGLLNLEFWGVAGSFLDLRQAKRLYGVIGTGEVVAVVGSGFLVPFLVARIGSENLVLLAGAATALCLPLLEWIQRHGHHLHPQSRLEASAPLSGKNRISPGQRQFVRLIFALVFLSILLRFLVDKSFLFVAHERFTNADDVAGFLGRLFAAAGAMTLAMRALVSGRLLQRFGLEVGLAILPLSLGLATATAAAAALGWLPAGLAFVSLAAAKFCDRTFRLSIDRSAVLLLYQPLTAGERARAQTLAEGVVGSLAAATAGGLLLLVDHIWSVNVAPLCVLILLCVGVWLFLTRLLRGLYPRALATALQRRHLRRSSLRASDPETHVLLRRTALDPRPAPALYALELLSEVDPAFVPTNLPALLDHPAPEVRVRALRTLESLPQHSGNGRLRELSDADPDPDVRAAALMALAAQDEEAVIGRLSELVSREPGPGLRGALVGLLRHGSLEGILAAAPALEALLRSPEPWHRALGAEVLGAVGGQTLVRPLRGLLVDPDPQVRRSALLAAGQVRSRRLWPLVVEGLSSSECRGEAVRALMAAGEEAVEPLSEALMVSRLGSEQERRLLRLLGRTRSKRALPLLQERITAADPAIRRAALEALALCRYRPEGAEREKAAFQLHREVGDGAWLLEALLECSCTPERSGPLLPMALEEELDRCRQRILILLEFLHPGRAVREARAHYWARSRRERAIALELLESSVGPVLRAETYPILERAEPSSALRELPERQRPRRLTVPERLHQILETPEGRQHGSWIRTCALHAMARNPLPEYREAIQRGIESPDPVEAETALLAAWALEPAAIAPVAAATDPHHHARSHGLVHQMTGQGEVGMGSATVERVLLLRNVGIFASTPGDVLAQLALDIVEVELAAGETLFSQGDLGTSMFVVVDGRVRVHLEGETLAELGEGEIVGELAALDPEPRSASVTALVPSRLFRIDQELLLELMADQPEIVRGVIHELAQRIRRSSVR